MESETDPRLTIGSVPMMTRPHGERGMRRIGGKDKKAKRSSCEDRPDQTGNIDREGESEY